MTKPKLLIFLHGFGFDKDNNKESIQQLADGLGVEYFSFNGLFNSQRERGGYSRFGLDRVTKKSIFDDKFYKSIDYINFTINKQLEKRNIERKDIILCGRSQGAFMAIYKGLTNDEKCHSIISLCGFAREGININIKSMPEIIRLEAKNDTVLSQERKESYKKLQEDGIKIKYILDKESNHDEISRKGINKIIEKYNRK
ncbi:MAG TPA: hypothetical protein VJ892_02750 [Candidatus Absconditabacterales bacterium]|nr:hypothetical protein [Candidatus Absconditabacterales bacterium]